MVITAVSSSISRTMALISALPASSDARNLRCPETTSNLPSSAGRTRIGLITPPAMMLSMVSCISSSSSFTLNGWFLNGRSLSSGSSTTCSATSHSGFGSVRACSCKSQLKRDKKSQLKKDRKSQIKRENIQTILKCFP